MEFYITRRVGTERNGKTIFIFARSRPFPTYFGLKRSHNGVFLFFEFFTIFFELSLIPRVGTKRNDNFLFSLFFSRFQLFLAWEVAIIGFFNFLKIFTIFGNFLLHVGRERNGTTIFIFSISRHFPPYFDLKWSPNGIICFFDFSSFFFGIFYYPSGRNGTERQFLFFIFLGFSQPILSWNEAITVFFNLLNFFAIFLEYYLKRQGGTKRNNNFYFLSPSFFQPILAWNHAIMVFFNFLNFLLFFWNFLLRVGWERNGTPIFIFSICQPIPTYFGLKWSHNRVF